VKPAPKWLGLILGYSLCDLDHSQCNRSVVSQQEAKRGPFMTPLRTAALVVLFALAALSAVETFVESYPRGGGLVVSATNETRSDTH
jgi:hypothetical protein